MSNSRDIWTCDEAQTARGCSQRHRAYQVGRLHCQFEQQVQAMRQQSDADRERIASLKASQRDMQQFIFQFIASQQSVEQPSSEGDDSAGENDGEAQVRLSDMITIDITCILTSVCYYSTCEFTQSLMRQVFGYNFIW